MGDEIEDAVTLWADYDPAVWLVGPLPGDDVSEWLAATLAAVCDDFGIEADAPAADVTGKILEHFAAADLQCEYRLLRMRFLGDALVVARINLLRHSEIDPLSLWDENLQFYDRQPKIVILDEAMGLRRASRLYVDGHLRTIVRYHRALPDWDIALVLTCAGPDPALMASGLPDLDALSRSLWLVGADGVRR